LTGPVSPFLRAKENPLSYRQSGFRCSHALAEFLKRPQAEYQIGAEWLFYQILRHFYTV
jgi:hypothetical protein